MDDDDDACPLCLEPMDITDRQVEFCQCGYQMCLWCWHQIMENASKDNLPGRCPACRMVYDKERITKGRVDPTKLAKEQEKKKRREAGRGKGGRTGQRENGADADASYASRKHLKNVRVIQRNLVYAIGIPLKYCKEETLRKSEFFGKYGKILKVSVNRNGVYSTSSGSGSSSGGTGPTGSAYVTFMLEKNAVDCIRKIDGTMLETHTVRACFGTTKYCIAFLKNQVCNNPDCLYLHEIGQHADSFTKEEMVTKAGSSKTSSFHDLTHPGQRGGEGLNVRANGVPVNGGPVRVRSSSKESDSAAAGENGTQGTSGPSHLPSNGTSEALQDPSPFLGILSALGAQGSKAPPMPGITPQMYAESERAKGILKLVGESGVSSPGPAMRAGMQAGSEAGATEARAGAAAPGVPKLTSGLQQQLMMMQGLTIGASPPLESLTSLTAATELPFQDRPGGAQGKTPHISPHNGERLPQVISNGHMPHGLAHSGRPLELGSGLGGLFGNAGGGYNFDPFGGMKLAGAPGLDWAHSAHPAPGFAPGPARQTPSAAEASGGSSSGQDGAPSPVRTTSRFSFAHGAEGGKGEGGGPITAPPGFSA